MWTLQSKYSTFMFDSFFFGFLTIVGLIFLGWSLSVDLKVYKTNRKSFLLLPLISSLLFILTISYLDYEIKRSFNKPTLIKAFYDGDFNGTGIDFKTDGTFIFDNTAIGCSDYIYGEYSIDDSIINLSTNNLDNVVRTSYLKIKPLNSSSNNTSSYFIYQIEKGGEILKKRIKFRVVEDNRE